ncbi:MAG TPA: SMP-30/gluconolactonase/LRE family protein [Ktedonobacteraceae bacterium]|nr:SMP-30/gluconolactonase/LRE family protein [Ktedonobacteraceae bacterium]
MNNSPVPIKEFHLELSDLTYTGHDLVRPESVLAQPDGTLWTSDGRGGVTRINPDGTQQFIDGLGGSEPNGLALADDGSLIIANLGMGKVQTLYPDGSVKDLLTEVDGVSITTPNFVFLDSRNRLWVSVMTREPHWWPAAAVPRPDGYIVLVDEKGPRIVADGLYLTNEIRLDAQEEYLYAVETMRNHMIRFRVQPDGSLTDQEIFGPANLGTGAAIDGFTFDADGNLWVTLVLRNGLGVITPDGDYHVVIEDPREDILKGFEEKVANGTAEPGDMAMAVGSNLQFITSMTFGGPDLRTAYLGSLAMNALPTFQAPVAGLPLRHWK